MRAFAARMFLSIRPRSLTSAPQVAGSAEGLGGKTIRGGGRAGGPAAQPVAMRQATMAAIRLLHKADSTAIPIEPAPREEINADGAIPSQDYRIRSKLGGLTLHSFVDQFPGRVRV